MKKLIVFSSNLPSLIQFILFLSHNFCKLIRFIQQKLFHIADDNSRGLLMNNDVESQGVYYYIKKIHKDAINTMKSLVGIFSKDYRLLILKVI